MKSSPKKSKTPQDKTNPKKMPINRGVNKATRTSAVNVLHDQFQRDHYFWGAVFLIVIAVFLAYSNSFTGPFIYDDLAVVIDNPTIRSPSLQNNQVGLNNAAAHVAFSRPVTNWTFAFNYALGGLNPFGYHIFNVLIHLCSSLFVFGIIRRTLLSKPLKERWGDHALLLSLAIALLWAMHPLQTNAIDYITQRLESLAGFFYLATFYCLIRGSEPKKSMLWLSIGVLAAFLGMGSKETMVTAPVILLLYDRTFLAGGFKEAVTKRAGFYFGLVLAWVFLVTLLINGHNGSIGVNGRGGTSNTWSYAATQLGVVLHYLKLTVWPNPLILDNYWPVANTLNAILWPGLAVSLMAGLTLWGFIKNRPWAFIGLWFFIILSPSSSFVPIMDEYVNEYRMYLPVLAPIALLVMGLYVGLQQAAAKCLSNKIGGLGQITNLIFASMLVAAVVAFGITTYERNKDYSNAIRIWSDNIEKTPSNPRAHNNLAFALFQEDRAQEAINEVRKAIELKANFVDAYSSLGDYLAKANQLEAAIQAYTKVIELNPNYANIHGKLGAVLALNKQLDSAVAELKIELTLNPASPAASENLQVVLSQQALQLNRIGKNYASIEKLKEVLAINPNNADAKKNLAILTGK